MINDWKEKLALYLWGKKLSLNAKESAKTIYPFIESLIQEARIDAFKEIVALRSGAVYDDYSSLYQHSAEIWIEYAKQEGEFLNKQLAPLTKIAIK